MYILFNTDRSIQETAHDRLKQQTFNENGFIKRHTTHFVQFLFLS